MSGMLWEEELVDAWVDYYVCDGDDIVDLFCALFGELSLV